MTFTYAILLGLCVYRITLIIIWDRFPPARWTREKILGLKWLPDSVAYLWTCPWCMSFWVAIPIVLTFAPVGTGWREKIIAIFAYSAVSGLIHKEV